MKAKGFTLVELLTVAAIIAIIIYAGKILIVDLAECSKNGGTMVETWKGVECVQLAKPKER